MAVVGDILTERDCGVVRRGVSQLGHKDVLALAKEFDLREDPAAFVEIPDSEALSLVTSILHKDMAYGCPMMPPERANELARRFTALFGPRARHFSNGWPGGWYSATDATFDTGVLVIGDQCSGCLWVEDED